MADSAALVNDQSRSYSTAVNFTLSKGWKSFKAKLKGSKVYFYTLLATGELSHRVSKRMFSRQRHLTMVAGLVKPEKIVPSGRIKWAHWGRRTHTQLVVGTDGVETGTFESLVHEAVFAATFVEAQDIATLQTGLNKVAVEGSWMEGPMQRNTSLPDFSIFAFTSTLGILPLHLLQPVLTVQLHPCC